MVEIREKKEEILEYQKTRYNNPLILQVYTSFCEKQGRKEKKIEELRFLGEIKKPPD
jgi:hypothetical protein